MVFPCLRKEPVKKTIEKVNVSGGPARKNSQKIKNQKNSKKVPQNRKKINGYQVQFVKGQT